MEAAAHAAQQHLPSAVALRGAVRPAHRWVGRFVRAGFLGNGILYLVIGGLALSYATRGVGRLLDVDGALVTIRQDVGEWLLIALAIGFFSYALWRVVGAVVDAAGDGTAARGLARRGVNVLKGAAYAAVGVDAVLVARHAGARGGWPAALMSGRYGPAPLWIIGCGALAFGCYECYRGYTGELSAHLNLRRLNRTARDWIVGVSRAGIAGRGAVIALTGGLVVQAAMHLPQAHVRNPTQALRKVANSGGHPDWTYAVVGFGLLAYGVYLVALAFYRDVDGA